MNQESKRLPGTADLPRDMLPQRELWPAIAARLEPRSTRQPAAGVTNHVRQHLPLNWMGLAASLFVALGAGVLLGRQLGDGTAPISTPDSAANMAPELVSATPTGANWQGSANPSLLAALEAGEREYRSALREFTRLDATPDFLDAAAQSGVETSWSEMREAELALTEALERHPGNAFLVSRLLELRGQQLAFLRKIHLLETGNRRSI